MSRVGDKNEDGRGASIAQISDAARRRGERPTGRRRAEPLEPDPSVGTELITSIDAGEFYEPIDEPADDVLDQILAGRRPGADAPSEGSLPEADLEDSPLTTGLPRRDDYDNVREQLEHHHSRRRPNRPPTTPRGSADLALTDQTIAGRAAQRSRQAARSSHRRLPRRRVVASIAIVAVVAVIVAAVINASSTSSHRSNLPPRLGTVSAVNPSSTTSAGLRRFIAAISTNIKAEATLAGRARTRSRAQAEARERTKAKRARKQRQAAAAARVRARARSVPPIRVSSPLTTATQSGSSPTPTSSTTSTSSTPAHHTSSSHQPAFGENGILGPGTSPDS